MRTRAAFYLWIAVAVILLVAWFAVFGQPEPSPLSTHVEENR